MVVQALDLSSMSAFSAVPAPFGVLLGLKSVYHQRLASSCRRGSFCATASRARERRRCPLVLRGDGAHSCFAKPVVEDARERRRDHLHADGGIAVLVVRLMTVLDAAVTLRVLLRRDIASERVKSEASTTP